MSDSFEWTPRATGLLRQLWDQGYSTRIIGEHLGCSKNSVVGKAHRMNLSGRASSIVHGPRKVPKTKQRPIALPALPALPSRAPLPPVLLAPFPSRPVMLPPVLVSFPPPVVSPVAEQVPSLVASMPTLGGMPCQWPMWAFGERPGRNPKFCGAARCFGGGSDCAEHHRKASDGRPAVLFAERAA